MKPQRRIAYLIIAPLIFALVFKIMTAVAVTLRISPTNGFEITASSK